MRGQRSDERGERASAPDERDERDERDACALVAVASKDARPTAAPLALVLHGLDRMSHRSGEIGGEGDGAGVLVDVPRALWADRLEEGGLAASLAHDPRFAIGHLFLPRTDPTAVAAAIRGSLQARGLEVLLERHGATSSSALLPRGRAEEPHFWQLALLARAGGRRADRALHGAAVEIESRTDATVVSLSRSTAVYKLRGSASPAAPVLRGPGRSPLPHLRRVRSQPLLDEHDQHVRPRSAVRVVRAQRRDRHDRPAARGVARPRRARVSAPAATRRMSTRCCAGSSTALGLDPVEAIELVFPPIVNESRGLPAEMQDAYAHARAAFGPFAQGPAAYLARFDDLCLFGVDALGLRPLWHVETDEEQSSRASAASSRSERYVADPRPLGPGEHAALERSNGAAGGSSTTRSSGRFVRSRPARRVATAGSATRLATGGPAAALKAGRAGRAGRGARVEVALPPDELDDHATAARAALRCARVRAGGPQTAAASWRGRRASRSASLGYDGPLAALSARAVNLADHLHESVAVVTNPAIDREREIEHFSTRVVVGPRPAPHRAGAPTARGSSWAADPSRRSRPRGRPRRLEARALARRLGTWVCHDLVAHLGRRARPSPRRDRDWEEPLRDALARVAAAACAGVRAGARLVVVEDRAAIEEGRSWIDLLLASRPPCTTRSSPALADAEPLRRDCSVVWPPRACATSTTSWSPSASARTPSRRTCSSSTRSRSGTRTAQRTSSRRCVKGSRKSSRHSASHELRGYGRAFSAIGLAPDVARLLGVRTFAASDGRGRRLAGSRGEGEERARLLRERTPARLEHPYRIYPRVWKAALAVANGEALYASYAAKLEEQEREHPVALRHVLDLKLVRPGPASPDLAEPRQGTRGSASTRRPSTSRACRSAPRARPPTARTRRPPTAWGSSASTARAGSCRTSLAATRRTADSRSPPAASACRRCSRTRRTTSRSRSARARSRARAGTCRGARCPSAVALARNARPGVDLISPSNNHDIYSIEDLAQVVHELRAREPAGEGRG